MDAWHIVSGATGLIALVFIFLFAFVREERAHRDTKNRLLAANGTVELLKLRSEQLERELTFARQSYDRHWNEHTKLANDYNTAVDTIAQLQSQIATLQAAQRIREANRS